MDKFFFGRLIGLRRLIWRMSFRRCLDRRFFHEEGGYQRDQGKDDYREKAVLERCGQRLLGNRAGRQMTHQIARG